MHVDPVILERTFFLSRPGVDFSLHKDLGTLSAHELCLHPPGNTANLQKSRTPPVSTIISKNSQI